MKTLSDFIETARIPQSETVYHSDWDNLYVRRSKVYVGDVFMEVFVLANITAEKPGTGAFQRLLKELPRHLVIECVQNPRFRDHLERNNWIKIGDGFSYYRENKQNEILSNTI